MIVDIRREDSRGNVLRLMKPVRIKWKHFSFVVPKGFESDGVSVPRLLWSLISPAIHQKTIRAGIGHDWIYRSQPEQWSRAMADQMFYKLCREDGLVWWRAALAYVGLRLFGFIAWNQNKKDLKHG